LFPSAAGKPLTSNDVGTALYNRRDRLPIDLFKSHDLRRTAVSLMLEIGIARDTVGAIIGHGADDTGSSRVLLKHYSKTNLIALKAKALEVWDARLHAIISGAPAKNVVHLHYGK
jgi:integrase